MSALKQEYESLLAPVLDRAWATARRLTRNDADAQDLVQDAALLAWRGFASFERGTNFRAWFLRIMMNAFLSGRRKHRVEDTAVALDDLPNAFIQRKAHELIPAAEAAPGQGPADLARAVLDHLESEQVEAAIDALPDEFRTVATLYFLQDLPYQEIATMLGIPVGTVRSRLHRGRALLQRSLWQVAADHGIVPERKVTP